VPATGSHMSSFAASCFVNADEWPIMGQWWFPHVQWRVAS
jgi:hypothetical protein